jgi:translation initiation factor 3 subunit F
MPKKTALEVLMRSKSEGSSQTTIFTELASFENALTQIQKLLETIGEYVDKVVAGDVSSNNSIGRFLSTTISSLPLIHPATFDKMWNNHLQDLLMVVYLANLTRTQLALAERLQTLS